MNERDRVALSECPAAVDDFLSAALHLGITALHGGEIEIGTRAAAAERGGCAAAEADQHRRPPEHDEPRADGRRSLLHVRAAYVADAARDHDRLVIAANPVRWIPRRRLLEGAKVPADCRTPELVVEGGSADRPLDHDLERRGDVSGCAELALPRALVPRDAQVRHREPGETGLGLRAAPGRSFITNLPSRAG